MNQSKISYRAQYFTWISVVSLVVSALLMPNAANSATSGSQTVGFSIAGGDMGGGGGGGGGDTCLPVDYTLSTSLGAAVSDPTAGSSWTSSDINITQTNGTGCPGNTVVTAASLDVNASNFTNSLGSAPNVLCDGNNLNNVYGGTGTSDSCPSSTTKVNVNVYVPSDAAAGVTYESTVTITAVL